MAEPSSSVGPTYEYHAASSSPSSKATIVGAAETVIRTRAGAFYRRYESWEQAGLSFKNARRNVARDIAQTVWSMWKNGREFDERLIGGASACASDAGGHGF